MQIDIDFEVFKELTARRTHEGHTYNEVIRDLLKLKPSLGRRVTEALTFPPPNKGLALKGLFLPEGTRLRVTYKGQLHTAEIRNGRWVDESGLEHSSPSAAATHITQTNVNGWRFWEAKRPDDAEWRKLDHLTRG